MTEKDRLDLFMKTPLADFISEDFKTYLLAEGFFRSRQAPSITELMKVVCSTIPLQ